MKKVIAILYTLILLLTVYSGAVKTEQQVYTTPKEVIDTITYPDYSQLYTCKQDKAHDTCLTVNIQDAQLLMKVARQEGGPTLNGQLWAMRVIYNRLYNGNFGNSIWEIVSADGQFEVFTNGSYINADVNPESHIALAMIESGWDKTQGALYWRTDAGSKDSWHENNLQYIATVEGNRYYK